MIRLELDIAISAYLCISIFLVILCWVFYNYKRPAEYIGSKDSLRQCPFCMHVFFNYRSEDIIICPLCKSYIHSEQEDKKGLS